MIQPWQIVLICLGAILLAALLMWALYEVFARRRRKQHREDFQQRVYDHEKDRAERTLAALQAANLARAGAGVSCNHGYQIPQGSVRPERGGCPACQSAGHYLYAAPPPQYPPASPHSIPPQQYIPSQQIVPQPYGASTQMATYPQGTYAPRYESQQYGQASPFNGDPRRPNIRLAHTDMEVPQSPPPIAPPGFVTVPMVIEHQR